MKIRKYEGGNEKEAMLKVKNELGSDALIVSVKNIRPKGIYRLFKKPYVEVTAALDDRSVLDDGDREPNIPRKSTGRKSPEMSRADSDDNEAYLERFKNLIDRLPEEGLMPRGGSAGRSKFDVAVGDAVSGEKDRSSNDDVNGSGVLLDEGAANSSVAGINRSRISESGVTTDGAGGRGGYDVINAQIIKAVYEQLIDNEVREEIVNQLTTGLEQLRSDDQEEVADVISVIYKRVLKLLSGNETISADKKNTVFFVGPTGVGKTTTIAKIASYFTLNLGKRVALITSDTYRIAAVEQLRTYANILNIPIKVVYSGEELNEAVEHFSDRDLILVDTAGRSHKNTEHQEELRGLMDAVDEKEVYLVLSVATKYKDLLKITQVYDEMTDYKIIFTKLDETSCYGNILNMKIETGAKLSYVTFGQNVPDDISDINPHEIARQVLGGQE